MASDMLGIGRGEGMRLRRSTAGIEIVVSGFPELCLPNPTDIGYS